MLYGAAVIVIKSLLKKINVCIMKSFVIKSVSKRRKTTRTMTMTMNVFTKVVVVLGVVEVVIIHPPVMHQEILMDDGYNILRQLMYCRKTR